MRWKLVSLAAVVLLAGLGWWALRGRDPAPATPELQAAEPALAPPELPVPPVAPQGAEILGRVHRHGVSVAGAHVVARDEVMATEVRSDASGAFRLVGLRPGRYWVSAALEDEASRLAGPIALETFGRREGVELELLAAGTVRGAVFDSVTRAPVAGAVVRTSGGSSTSDSAGRFALRGLPAGDTWIDATATGYSHRTEWLTLEAARELGGMEIFLHPAGVVSGTVRRMGRAVAGALVWAEASGLAAGQRSYGPTTSAADGTYQLPVEGGALRLAAAAAQGARVEGPAVTLGEGEGKRGVDIDLGEGLEVSGVVRVGGAPAVGASLWLLDGKTERVAASAVTLAGGRFVASGLAAGSYLVQVERGATHAQRGPFALQESGAEWTIDIEGSLGLSGTVSPPKAGVAVRWRSTDWAGPVPAEALTDAAGKFRFELVPSGTLWVEAQDSAGSAKVQATAGSEVHLELVPAVLRGVVLDASGHPVTDFTVRLVPVEGGPLRSYPVLNPTGDFRLSVPPGTYEVSALAPGYGETGERPRLTIENGETSVKLSLLPSAEVSGTVVDAASRAPLSGAQVIVFRAPFGAGRWATLVTDGAGAFHLSAAPTSAVLQVHKEGYSPAWAPLERLPRGPDGNRVEVALTAGTDDVPGNKPYEGVGLQLDFRGGVKVASVFEGGPAETAGVLTGDALLAADGQPFAGLSAQDVVARIMGPSGTVVRLSLQRGDQTFDVMVRRRGIQF